MPVSIGPTLSRNNQQPVFLTQGNGVIYIKIARKDNNGNDNTLSLQELNNIRVKFSDRGIVDYPVVNITEYPDYYLYQISRVNATSSADDNIRNYKFSASAYIPPISGIILQDGEAWSGSGLFPSIDVLNYFNTSSAVYTFRDTPNVIIKFTGSVLFNGGMTGDFGLYQNLGSPSTGPFQPTVVKAAAFPAGNAVITGSFTPIEGYSYSFRINNESGVAITASNMEWQFTQSINPNVASNLTILEPYLDSEFEYSDCNVLLNNVDQNQIGSFFRRVLYDDGSTIPSNFQQILSQSAEYAEVKDYNYSARAQILPRYDGVRTTSPDFNLRTINSNVYEGTRLNSIATGDPNVQSLGTYFAYFDWMGGTTPELIGKAAAHLLYLIDEEGNVQNPNISSSYYYNLIDNFESDKKANIVLNAISGNPQIIGNIPIIRAGALPMPIIASQTSSGYNIAQTMSFYNPLLPIPPDYTYIFPGSSTNQVVNPNSSVIFDLTSPTIPTSTPNISVNTTSNFIQIVTTSNLTQIALQFNFKAYSIYGGFGSGNGFNAQISFQKSTNNFTNYTNLASFTAFITAGIPPVVSTYSYTSPYFSPISGEQYRVVVNNPAGNYIMSIEPVSQLQTIQNVPSFGATASYDPGNSLYYWTNGATSLNILTGSQFGYTIYNPNSPTTQQSNTAEFLNSGYYPFLPFSLITGDQIRFEGDENQVYTILTVSASNPALYLTLDRNVTPGTDLDSFLIKRFDSNPNFITLDSNLASYQGGGGFIFPQYTTNALQANFDRIIKDLKEKGLIS
jgi:hypothetical protein